MTFSLLFRYFSYEHFYVIYCRFWELDGDHDFLIDKENLLKYGNHALTYRIVDRIFSQVGSRCQNVTEHSFQNLLLLMCFLIHIAAVSELGPKEIY